ncbi:MAG: restriction endonuclease subunit S [Rhodothermaceae bacterium]|nr:restriction endonuclease subunit S [Rhodothermaceae bacterium]
MKFRSLCSPPPRCKTFDQSSVEYVELGELLNYEQPSKYLVESVEYDDKFTTPVLTAGKTFVLGYTSDTDGIYAASFAEPVIIFDDFTTAFKWVEFPFKAKSSAMKIITPKSGSRINIRYIYYAMKTIPYSPQDHARQWIRVYSRLRIPVPPLETQHEIVDILDKFDALVNDLSIGLPAEINARRRQYEYYRDRLLTFKEAV